MTGIRENISQTLSRIEKTLRERGRCLSDITVVAVTKNHPVEAIETALECGISDYGENRVQEAQDKVPFITLPRARFHFIGHLQSNKVNALIDLDPAIIHSVDSEHLARKLDSACQKRRLIQDILIQVNTSGELSKSGINPDQALDLIRIVGSMEHLRIKGLMTIGILTDDEKKIRRCFQALRGLFDEAGRMGLERVEMRYLSMGMTDDYELALDEGSNCLRIGSAFFGQRLKGTNDVSAGSADRDAIVYVWRIFNGTGSGKEFSLAQYLPCRIRSGGFGKHLSECQQTAGDFGGGNRCQQELYLFAVVGYASGIGRKVFGDGRDRAVAYSGNAHRLRRGDADRALPAADTWFPGWTRHLYLCGIHCLYLFSADADHGGAGYVDSVLVQADTLCPVSDRDTAGDSDATDGVLLSVSYQGALQLFLYHHVWHCGVDGCAQRDSLQTIR